MSFQDSGRASPIGSSSALRTEKLWEAHEQVRALLPLQEHNARLASEVEVLKRRLRSQQEEHSHHQPLDASSRSYMLTSRGSSAASLSARGHQVGSAQTFGAVPDATAHSDYHATNSGDTTTALHNQSQIQTSPYRASFATRTLSPTRHHHNSNNSAALSSSPPLAAKVIEATSTQLSFNDQLHQYRSRALLIEKQLEDKDTMIAQLQADLRKAHDTTMAVTTQLELENTLAKQRADTELAVEKSRLHDARSALETAEKMLAQMTEEHGKLKGDLQHTRESKDAAERRQLAAEQSLSQQREELARLKKEAATLRHDNGMLAAVQQECDILRDSREAAKIQRRELEASEEELSKERYKRREADKKVLELEQKLNASEMFRRKAESDLRVASVEVAERASLRRELEDLLEQKRLCEVGKEDAEQQLKKLKMLHQDDISATDRLLANLSTQLMKLRQDGQNCFHDAETAAQRKVAMAAVEFADGNESSSVSQSHNAYASSRIDLMPKPPSSLGISPQNSAADHSSFGDAASVNVHLNNSRPGTPRSMSSLQGTQQGFQVLSPGRLPTSTPSAMTARTGPSANLVSSSSIDYTQSRVRQQGGLNRTGNSIFTGAVPQELQPAFSAVRSLLTDVIDAFYRERGDTNARLRHEVTSAKESNQKLEEALNRTNAELNRRALEVAELTSRLETAEHNTGSHRSNERFLRELVWSHMEQLFTHCLSKFDERGAAIAEDGREITAVDEDVAMPRWMSIILMTSKEGATHNKQPQYAHSSSADPESSVKGGRVSFVNQNSQRSGASLAAPPDCHSQFTDKTWRYLWEHFSSKVAHICEGGGSYRADNAQLNNTIRDLTVRIREERNKADEASRRQAAQHEEDIARLQAQHDNEIVRMRKLVDRNKKAEAERDSALRELEAANTTLKHVKDLYNTLKDEATVLESHSATLNETQSRALQRNSSLEARMEELEQNLQNAKQEIERISGEQRNEKIGADAMVDGAEVLVRYLLSCGLKICTLIAERNAMMQRCHGLEVALGLIEVQALQQSNATAYSGTAAKPLISPAYPTVASQPTAAVDVASRALVVANGDVPSGASNAPPPPRPLLHRRIISSVRVAAMAIIAARRLLTISKYSTGQIAPVAPFPALSSWSATYPSLSVRETLGSYFKSPSPQAFLNSIISHISTDGNGTRWWMEMTRGPLIHTIAPPVGGALATNPRPWQRPISMATAEIAGALQQYSASNRGCSESDVRAPLPLRRSYVPSWYRSMTYEYPRGRLISRSTTDAGLVVTIVGRSNNNSSSVSLPTNTIVDPLFTALTVCTLNNASVAVVSNLAAESQSRASLAMTEARHERKVAAEMLDRSVAMQNELANIAHERESGSLVAGSRLQAANDEVERLRAALKREEETRLEYDRRFAVMRTREVELLAAQSDIRNEARSLALEIVAMQETSGSGGLAAAPAATSRMKNILSSVSNPYSDWISPSRESIQHQSASNLASVAGTVQHGTYRSHPSAIAYMSPQGVPTYADHSVTAVSGVQRSSTEPSTGPTTASTSGLNVSGVQSSVTPLGWGESAARRPIPKPATRPPSAQQSEILTAAVAPSFTSAVSVAPAPSELHDAVSASTDDGIRPTFATAVSDSNLSVLNGASSVGAGGGGVPALSAIELNSGGYSRAPSSVKDPREIEDDDDERGYHEEEAKPQRYNAPDKTETSNMTGNSASVARHSREELLRLISGIDQRIQSALGPKS